MQPGTFSGRLADFPDLSGGGREEGEAELMDCEGPAEGGYAVPAGAGACLGGATSLAQQRAVTGSGGRSRLLSHWALAGGSSAVPTSSPSPFLPNGHAGGARAWVVVDTNVLIENLRLLGDSMDALAGAAAEARCGAAALDVAGHAASSRHLPVLLTLLPCCTARRSQHRPSARSALVQQGRAAAGGGAAGGALGGAAVSCAGAEAWAVHGLCGAGLRTAPGCCCHGPSYSAVLQI